MKKTRILSFVLPCVFLFGKIVFAQQDLTAMSMEDLMDVKVYSAAKKLEPIFDTAAAIFVITPEDIRRSGASNIPDLLRMVPGIRVQQINAHTWDISIRGFNGSIYANKLLVLIDGRSVYSSLFDGVFWEFQDVVLEDVDRIEVIRGPGGTLWGANAVNGVINIITKKAKDTQGTLVSMGGGSQDRAFSTVRYGGKAGDWLYRVYGKNFDYNKGFSTTGTDIDGWDQGQGGFRAEKDKLTLQGDYYQTYLGSQTEVSSFAPPYLQNVDNTSRNKGWNLLANYADDDWSFKTYWDVTDLRATTFNERRDQVDMEYNRLLSLSANQQITWGLGYHLDLEKESDTDSMTIQKPRQQDQVFSLFAQDEIKMLDDKLIFTAGSKLEHNIYTGFELEPNVRVLYHIDGTSEVWAAASRAVRTPSRLDSDGIVNQYNAEDSNVFHVPVFIRYLGNDDLKSEKEDAYELGYRDQLNSRIFYDLSLFYDHYDDLALFDVGRYTETIENGLVFLNVPTANGGEGEVHGAEISGDIKINEWWKLKGYYSFTKMSLKMKPDFEDVGLEALLNVETPVNTSYIRSSFDLPHGFELDATFRYTSTFDDGSVPAVAELDMNLSKEIKGWRVSLVGQNLIENHHREASASLYPTLTQVERAWYIKVTRRF